MSDDDSWFAPKRYGIGGVPIRWQGWALVLGFVAALAALISAFRGRPLQLIAAVVPLALAFAVIAARTTRGGMRWRWGEDE
jgi:prolipoprotein diacylglyceryltransferase